MERLAQPSASAGVRIGDGVRDRGGLSFDLPEVLDAIEPFVLGWSWEARFISSVWMERDPWADSWGDIVPRLDKEAIRDRYLGQIINGRFVALKDGREVLMIEAVDSSYWLVWSDDVAVLSALNERFNDVSPVTPPTPFRVHG